MKGIIIFISFTEMLKGKKLIFKSVIIICFFIQKIVLGVLSKYVLGTRQYLNSRNVDSIRVANVNKW